MSQLEADIAAARRVIAANRRSNPPHAEAARRWLEELGAALQATRRR